MEAGKCGWRGVSKRRSCSGREGEGGSVSENVGVGVLEEVDVVVHASISGVALLEAVFQVVESRVELALSLLLLASQSRQFRAHSTHLPLQLDDASVRRAILQQ